MGRSLAPLQSEPGLFRIIEAWNHLAILKDTVLIGVLAFWGSIYFATVSTPFPYELARTFTRTRSGSPCHTPYSR